MGEQAKCWIECTSGSPIRGTYRTPPFLVDYLLDRTLVPLLRIHAPPVECTSPASGPVFRILDPACGQGVFLLAAYAHLQCWYAARLGPLNWEQRLGIALRHLYGIDVDPLAVEATRAALAKALLEDDRIGTTELEEQEAYEAAMVRLASNIQCGDALIGPDFGNDIDGHNHEDVQRSGATHWANDEPVCPFDWWTGFPEAMGAGGFDLVFANPPYLSYSGRHSVPLLPSVRRYLLAHYKNTEWPCTHAFFLERAATTLARHSLAFVLPAQVGHLERYREARRVLTKHLPIVEVRYWGEGVFPEAVTPILTVIARRQCREPALVCGQGRQGYLPQTDDGRTWVAADALALWRKLWEKAETLGALVADVGVHTGNCASRLLVDAAAAAEGCAPILGGREVSRYACRRPTLALRLPYQRQPGDYFGIRPRQRYEQAAFLIRQTAPYPIVGPHRHGVYFRNSLLALYPPGDGRDVRYLAALLNSGLLRWAYQQAIPEAKQRTFPQVKVSSLRKLPIRALDLDNPLERRQHDLLVTLADEMLRLHEKLEPDPLAVDQLAVDQKEVQRQIQVADNQIDRLVYRLYGLTEEEIALVEDITH